MPAIFTPRITSSSAHNVDGRARFAPLAYEDFLWIVLVGIAATWAFLQSYQKWLDPIIDTGRDLYIPGELLNGKKLYRDIVYVYPPLTPYLLGFLTWPFGNGLSVYAAIGTGVSALIGGALYVIARMTVNPTGAGICSLLFVTLNFTAPWFNFVFPYSYAATFGEAFYLLYLGFILAYLFVERSGFYYLLALTFALLAAWTKIELAFAAGLTLPLLFIAYRLPARLLFASLLAALGSALFASFFFRDSPEGHHWLWDNILAQTLFESKGARLFYARAFGFEQFWNGIEEVALGALLIAISLGLIVAIDRTGGRGWPEKRWKRVVIVATSLAALVFLFLQLGSGRFFRAWALLQILLIPLAVVSRRCSPLLVLLLFSMIGSARIYLNLQPVRYGFSLILPTYLLIVYVFFRFLPERRVYSSPMALLWMPLFLLIMIRGQLDQVTHYSLKRYRVDTALGSYYDHFDARAAIIQRFLRYLDPPRHSGLVVMPEGVTLNYFSRIPSPISFHTFTPPETADAKIEQRIIEEIERSKPELVAINNRPVREYGSDGFGVDYDQRLLAYLEENYLPLRQWESPTFKLALLQRRAAGHGHERRGKNTAP